MAEERRLVTVLFADLAGASGPGEARDPEDVRALQTRYYRIARDVIGAHGGTVEKFIGDAFMAVFGLPHAHGDDCRVRGAATARGDDALGRVHAGHVLRRGLGTDEDDPVASFGPLHRPIRARQGTGLSASRTPPADARSAAGRLPWTNWCPPKPSARASAG